MVAQSDFDSFVPVSRDQLSLMMLVLELELALGPELPLD